MLRLRVTQSHVDWQHVYFIYIIQQIYIKYTMNIPLSTREIEEASDFLLDTWCVIRTPIEQQSSMYEWIPDLYIKREDLQPVKSFKIRWALNAMSLLDEAQKEKWVVCASAGNHAQWIAVACSYFQTQWTIFMPANAPDVKVWATKKFGGDFVDIKLVWETFDETKAASDIFTQEHWSTYVHPFDDTWVMIWASTIWYEIFQQMKEIGKQVDYIIVPVWWGWLVSWVISAKNLFSTHTTVIWAEPTGHASMKKSLQKGYVSKVLNPSSSKFADGTAVARVWDKTFDIAKDDHLHVIDVNKDRLWTYLQKMRDNSWIILEPSWVLSIAAIGQEIDTFRNKVVVAILSGWNIDEWRKDLINFLAERHKGYRKQQWKRPV